MTRPTEYLVYKAGLNNSITTDKIITNNIKFSAPSVTQYFVPLTFHHARPPGGLVCIEYNFIRRDIIHTLIDEMKT